MSVESAVNRFNRYVSQIMPGACGYDFTNKSDCISQHIAYMFNRTRSMFKWAGLPDTIPERTLELYLQMNGNAAFAEYDNKVYAFVGGRGGEPDPYYMPTKYVVSNPALKMSKTYTIDVDCVVVPNDTLYIGLYPLFQRYATLLTENEISYRTALINTRMYSIITAPDDRTRASVDEFLNSIENGNLAVVQDAPIFDEHGVKTQPYADRNINGLTSLIESEQYIKASWYNEIGLNANYNMKRESLNSSESQLNNDALLPLVDDMFECRKNAADKINQMFGLNISVDYASSWKDNIEEIDIAHGETLPDARKGGDTNA